jgi:2-methylaconitate cis-trans-isomerase PrpF
MRPSPCFSLRLRSYLYRNDVVPTTAPVQRPIEAAYYRGGTSRAVIIQPHHLPRERAKWPSIFRQIMGSGDPYGRQLDGMGAGISSLSKICLVEPYGKRTVKLEKAPRFRTGYGGIDAARDTAQAALAQEEASGSGDVQELDIDYTCVGLGIEHDEVDVAGNCGNMSSAIGPYAYNEGLLPPSAYVEGDGTVTVKIRNTNTGKLIDSTFEVVGGHAAVSGDYTIDGVTGPGSKIKLDFKHPYGSKTGKVLPTGKRMDTIRGYRVSCVDGANPAVFVRADDVGVDGTILPNDFNRLPDKLALLESIRKSAAVAMGIAPTEALVPRTIPKIGLVSQSSSHPVLSGQNLKSSQVDIVIRFLSDTQPHRAIPLTAALTTAVAARIPGTIVEQMLAPEPLTEGAITIGHASGRLHVNATMDERNRLMPVSGTVYRTAKRLFEGELFWTDKKENDSDAETSYGSNGRHSLGLAFVLENRGKSSQHLFVEAQPKDVEEVKSQQNTEQTLEQIELQESQDEEEGQQEPDTSYRPLPNPHWRITPALPNHPETPLTYSLHQLHSHLTDLLADPDLATRPYHPDLNATLENAYQRIVANSRARTKTTAGKEWHDFAKGFSKRKERVRKAVDRRAMEEEKVQRGKPKTGKADVGLDRSGKPVWQAVVKRAVEEDQVLRSKPRTRKAESGLDKRGKPVWDDAAQLRRQKRERDQMRREDREGGGNNERIGNRNREEGWSQFLP